MKKTKTAIERHKAIQQIGTEIEIPWNVYRLFGGPSKEISLVGQEICLGEDYGSVEQCRDAIEWFVNQLGGTVSWKD